MKTRISMLAAAAAIATMPLLAACGSSDQPPSPSAPAASQVASPAAASSAPATDTPATPSGAPTPSSEPSADTGEIEDAAEKWVKTALTLGYPDTSAKAYLARLEPLMTKTGFAKVEKQAKATKSLEAGIKTLSKNRGRSTPKLIGDTKVSSATAEKATAEIDYQLTQQQQTDGKWKTLRSNAKDDVKVTLVYEGGKWLVDDAF